MHKDIDTPACQCLGHSLLPLEAWNQVSALLRLSRRELEVVWGIFDDLKEEAIAHQMGISPHTVNTYVQRIYSKLNVSSRQQLVLRLMVEYLTIISRAHGLPARF
jgi:DNA-binding CsgD family transcriptional regulator